MEMHWDKKQELFQDEAVMTTPTNGTSPSLVITPRDVQCTSRSSVALKYNHARKQN